MQKIKHFLRQGISPVWAIIVIVVVSVIVGAGFLVSVYFWQPAEPQEQPSVLEIEDETADWQTYRNEEYGFEIKYPEDWIVEIKDPYDLCQAEPGYDCLASIQFSPPLNLSGDYSDISLIILSNLKRYSTMEWINRYTPELINDPSISMQDIKIEEKEGVKFVITEMDRREISFIVAKEEILLGIGTYEITGYIKKTEDILNHMLSTFRFIDFEKDQNKVERVKEFDLDKITEYILTICYFESGGLIIIKDVREKNVIQEIEFGYLSDRFSQSDFDKISTKDTILYGDTVPLFFEDFNFDDQKDLAIFDGNRGGYGSPIYKIYLFDQDQKKFIYDQEFSSLTHDLGMFFVDYEKQLIIKFSKSGCCWHEELIYKIINNNLVKFRRIIIDHGKRTEEEFRSGEWIIVNSEE